LLKDDAVLKTETVDSTNTVNFNLDEGNKYFVEVTVLNADTQAKIGVKIIQIYFCTDKGIMHSLYNPNISVEPSNPVNETIIEF
jgi:hypothetical protein